jgi:hypothetical protein
MASMDGYMSDGEALQNYYHPQSTGSPFLSGNPIRSSVASSSDRNSGNISEDGYLSEGGASFYARKIQTRIAIEKQKAAEEQRKKLGEVYESKRRPLPGLPDILGQPASTDPNQRSQKLSSPHLTKSSSTGGVSNMLTNGSPQSLQPQQQVYRVVGGRKHVQKSETGIQTDTASALKPSSRNYDWKQAMAHNARVLTNQEKAMDEYLKRQRLAAEQQLHQRYTHQQQKMISTKKMPLTGGMRQSPVPSYTASTPATPTGTRRAHARMNGGQRSESPGRQLVGNSNLPILADNPGLNGKMNTGGSLERYQRQMLQQMKMNHVGDNHSKYNNNAFSDSEYGQMANVVASPGSSRKVYSPAPPSSPTTGKRDGVFGSRSLPKGASTSLNYGLMLDKIQQNDNIGQAKTMMDQ